VSGCVRVRGCGFVGGVGCACGCECECACGCGFADRRMEGGLCRRMRALQVSSLTCTVNKKNSVQVVFKCPVRGRTLSA